jgi:hypothetical protein
LGEFFLAHKSVVGTAVALRTCWPVESVAIAVGRDEPLSGVLAFICGPQGIFENNPDEGWKRTEPDTQSLK